MVTSMNFDTIYNFYENLVFDAISSEMEKSQWQFNQNEVEDIACLALNALPARYVRHMVDTVYFQSDEERITMDKNILQAVRSAIEKVRQHPSLDNTGTSRSA